MQQITNQCIWWTLHLRHFSLFHLRLSFFLPVCWWFAHEGHPVLTVPFIWQRILSLAQSTALSFLNRSTFPTVFFFLSCCYFTTNILNQSGLYRIPASWRSESDLQGSVSPSFLSSFLPSFHFFFLSINLSYFLPSIHKSAPCLE